ncbi:hypothetical protein ES703_88014 [subsurface metagenome]
MTEREVESMVWLYGEGQPDQTGLSGKGTVCFCVKGYKFCPFYLCDQLSQRFFFKNNPVVFFSALGLFHVFS